jgi:hypothetical protein
MALNIFEEIDISSGGDNAEEGLTKSKNNWEDMDTELYAARGGETSLDVRIDAIDVLIANNTGEIIEAATKMWFYQNTAPTSWTIDTTVPDTLLAVKGGSDAYNATGGTSPGASTWTQPNHTHEMGSHTHTLSAHTHTGPEHNHQWRDYNAGGTDSYDLDGGGSDRTWQLSGAVEAFSTTGDLYTIKGGTGVTGVADPTDTDSVDPGDTNAGATAATWRPLGAVGIVATKDAFA